MEKMNRNEYFIKNIILLIQQMDEEELKQYIANISFNEAEQRLLYAKCISDLKLCSNCKGEEYKRELLRVCERYLAYEREEIPNVVKQQTNRRKSKTKQLNLDIEKEKMEKFDLYLKKNKDKKKRIIEKAIDEYIKNNETSS